jgi:hypothetical protein
VEVSNTPTIRRLIPHAVTNFRAYLELVSKRVLTRSTFSQIKDRITAN